jgi:hypothetical protein
VDERLQRYRTTAYDLRQILRRPGEFCQLASLGRPSVVGAD